MKTLRFELRCDIPVPHDSKEITHAYLLTDAAWRRQETFRIGVVGENEAHRLLAEIVQEELAYEIDLVPARLPWPGLGRSRSSF